VNGRPGIIVAICTDGSETSATCACAEDDRVHEFPGDLGRYGYSSVSNGREKRLTRPIMLRKFELRALAFALLVMGIADFPRAEDAVGAKPLLRFVQISDGHAMFKSDAGKAHDFGGRLYSRSIEILDGATKYMQETLRPDFVLYTGDMVENGGWPSGLDTMQHVRNVFASRRLRLFPVFGNHEVNERKYEEVFGLADYMFQYGNFHFVVLKVLQYYANLRQRHLRIPKHVLYQLDDFLSYCRGNVIVFLHEPLVCDKNSERWARPSNHEVVMRVLERHQNVLMVLQGHTHFYHRERINEIDYIVCPGLVDAGDRRGDASLSHCMLVYDAWADRVEVRMHGALTTEAAIQGQYVESSKLEFSVPLKNKVYLGKEAPERGLRAIGLPSSMSRYDPEIETAMKYVALYLFKGWRLQTDSQDRGLEQGWHLSEYDDSGWRLNKHLEHPWEVYHVKDYDGYAWYRVRFTVPKELANERLSSVLGRIDDCDETYLNGVLIGKTGNFPPAKNDPKSKTVYRNYPLPSANVRFGAENVIAIRVYDANQSGGMVRGRPFLQFAAD